MVLTSKIPCPHGHRQNHPVLSHVCPYCNKSHNNRDSPMNHVQFHYRMVLVCPICSGMDQINGVLSKGISRTVLQLNLMWLTGMSNQASHIGENQTHHLRTTLELQRQRFHTLCQYSLTHQMMRRLHIKAKSSNVFERNGQPTSPTSEKLQKPTRMMMVKSTKVRANRANRSLNEPLTVPKRRRTHH